MLTFEMQVRTPALILTIETVIRDGTPSACVECMPVEGSVVCTHKLTVFQLLVGMVHL